jgi:sulfite exporter TauE/SafE
LPIASLPRALAFGMVWGWMPCGFVYAVLLIATLQQRALAGAMTMAAFGLGTAPALLIAGLGAERLTTWAARLGVRRVAASALLISALVTLSGAWPLHLH